MTTLPCPYCGKSPTEMWVHSLYNVKCETPDCVSYPDPEFIDRSMSGAVDPWVIAAQRWNDWAANQQVVTA